MSPVELEIRLKKPGQRACDIKDAKGKFCVGHLKRWYTPDEKSLKQIEEVLKQPAAEVEIYRCEHCHTLYRPAPEDRSTAGQKYERRTVNLLGDTVKKES